MFKSRISVLFLAVLLLTGCGTRTITGSGNVATQEQAITGFDQVSISHSFEANISQGDTFSVVVRVDDNLVEYLEVVKQDDTLKIDLIPDTPNILRATMQAEITMPELVGLDVSGASHVTITGFESARDLVVDLSGSSQLRGDVKAGDASFDLSGSNDVILTGSAQNMMIKAAGSNDVDLADFPVVDASVDLSGSSEVTVNLSGRLDLDASGSSTLYYLGNPRLGNMDLSGSSSIEQK